MDKDTRNAIERATQRARKLLNDDFVEQLAGDFDVHQDGTAAEGPGEHLKSKPREISRRQKIVAAIEHKRATGMSAAEAVVDYLRDAAFTTLNRFVALKMLEARELVQECISKGEESAGYREFCGMAPGVALLPDSAGYRLYIESLFDELSTEVKVLFDRRDPASVLWPKRATFEALLEILNTADLVSVWGQDETIGWVYQYFNSKEERAAMRDSKQGGSQAPRNSRELAVRNQFFTPRYVVQFLTDNTLGRIWYEMRESQTALVDHCEYLVKRPDETYPPRAKKDPRDIRVLDPACGSGHFLLYAFALLLVIYEEAYRDADSPESTATGRTLADDYASIGALRRALPGLILAYNLHGVDIDPRCAQIAQLALWMRVQRAFRDFGVGRAERPLIRRSNIVVAEPLVTDDGTLKEFLAKLGDANLGRVFTDLSETLRLAGELGLLLPLETLMRDDIPAGQTRRLFDPSEESIRSALHQFAEESVTQKRTVRRLFADDALAGLGLLEVAGKKFDIVVMNPPFGDCTASAKPLLFKMFGRERIDLGGCFVTRFLERLEAGGKLGVIANRTLLFAATLDEWRTERLGGVTAVVDLGHGVLDALVETAAFTVAREPAQTTVFIAALDSTYKDEYIGTRIREVRAGAASTLRHVADFKALFGAPFAYWAPSSLIAKVARLRPSEAISAIARQGLATCDNFRYLRLADELPAGAAGWVPLTKGGEYQPFWSEVPLRVRWANNGRELKAYVDALHGQWSRVVQSTNLYGIPGATYSGRTASSLSLRVLPRSSIFDKKGPFVGAATEELSIRVALRLIGLSYTTPYRFLIETSVGLRDGTTSGSAARDYLPSMVQRLPWPDLSDVDWDRVERCTRLAVEAFREQSATDESSEFWHEPLPWNHFQSLAAFATARRTRWCGLQAHIYVAAEELEELGQRAVGTSDKADKEALEAVAGRNIFAYERRPVADVDKLQQLMDLPSDQLISELARAGNAHSTIYKKGYWGDRSIELVSHLWQIHPACLLESLKATPASPRWIETTAWRVLSSAMALAVGRVRADGLFVATTKIIPTDLFATPQVDFRVRQPGACAILVDDTGHAADVVRRVEDMISTHFTPSVANEVVRTLSGGRNATLRDLIAYAFFSHHLSEYSNFRRQAPVYWQLATPSASYSAWLYLHALTKDTFYSLQNEFVANKLAHEARKLESMRLEYGEDAKASERRQLLAQESFVEELRVFLEEVKRVAPLWNPNLDDGVIINFAPLWRLVSHHKPWQKELKSTWDALCTGDYDWAHLAMHLWPERVIPKCTTDRSLAIAHGLDNEFWVEESDGKWKPRPTPLKSVEELVCDRSSPAVKAALKSLLDASTASGSGRARGRRAAIPAVVQGGSR